MLSGKTLQQHTAFWLANITVLGFWLSLPTYAEISLDGSLGQAGHINGPDFLIEQSFGQQRGQNLFHSFSQFNINNTESAHFASDTSVSNIFSRVTGGNPSLIDGALSADANLYFMNPAGIMFGPNSSVNINGSLHVTTADYISFSNNEQFFAELGNNSILTVAEPSAFGFLDNDIAAIDIVGDRASFTTGRIDMDTDESLTIVGGDISFSEHLTGVGNLYIGAINSVGEVIFADNDFTLAPDTATGNVFIDNSSFIHVRPAPNLSNHLIIYANTLTNNGQILVNQQYINSQVKILVNQYISNFGSIRVNATLENNLVPHFLLEARENIELSFGEISLLTQSNEASSSNNLDKHMVIKTNNLFMDNSARISSRSQTFFNGLSSNVDIVPGGNIVIEAANQIDIFNTSRIAAGGQFATSGEIHISANRLNIDGSGSTSPFNRTGIPGESTPNGSAADISIHVNELNILNGGLISTNTGSSPDSRLINIQAENINIDGQDSELFTGIRAQTTGEFTFNNSDSGDGGNINIIADNITIKNAGQISVKSTSGSGNAGEITIDANDIKVIHGGSINSDTLGEGKAGSITIDSEKLLIDGSGTELLTGITSSALLDSSGNAGDIILSSKNIEVHNEGLVSSSTLGHGNAGSVRLNTQDLLLDNQALISSLSSSAGNAGKVAVTATGDFTLNNNSFISTVAKDSFDPNNPASISIYANKLSLIQNSQITTQAIGNADAGAIDLQIAERVELLGASRISTESNSGGGGRIDLQTKTLLYLQDSSITTSVAQDTGNGGDIFIDPIFVILDNSSIIAQANTGNGGNINIITDFLIQSPSSVISASSALGIDGTININSPDIDIEDDIAALPEDFLDARQWLSVPCSRRVGDNTSHLFVSGRDGAFSSPNDLRSIPPLARLFRKSIDRQRLAQQEAPTMGSIRGSEELHLSVWGCTKAEI